MSEYLYAFLDDGVTLKIDPKNSQVTRYKAGEVPRVFPTQPCPNASVALRIRGAIKDIYPFDHTASCYDWIYSELNALEFSTDLGRTVENGLSRQAVQQMHKCARFLQELSDNLNNNNGECNERF